VPKLAEEAELNVNTLYRTLSPKGNPELKSLRTLLQAMEMRLTVRPLRKPVALFRAQAALSDQQTAGVAFARIVWKPRHDFVQRFQTSRTKIVTPHCATPYVKLRWYRMAPGMGLGTSLKPRGRPKKEKEKVEMCFFFFWHGRRTIRARDWGEPT
jgi:hypothetical protein